MLLWLCLVALCVSRTTISTTSLTLSSYTIPSEEWNALHDIYNLADGDLWIWAPSLGTQPWNFSIQSNGEYENPCAPIAGWKGVTCSSTVCSIASPCNIIELNLGSMGLRNEISRTITSLTKLQSLNLSTNPLLKYNALQSLSSTFTTTTLQQLSIFNFRGSGLRGTIPSSLCQLLSLKSLSLNLNMLNGTIPHCIGYNLTKLQSLNLDSNQLTGIIPSSLSYLSNLLLLDLSSNNLNGSLPDSLSTLTTLTSLDISLNRLTHTIPESYYTSLLQLQILNLYNNLITGTISPSIGNLIQLLELGYFNMRLTGSIPDTIGKLLHVKQIGLFNNYLTGSIPLTIGKLYNLQSISFYHNLLYGNLSSHCFDNTTSLQIFYSSHNQLTGSLPVILSSKLMKVLSINNNELSNSLPHYLCNMISLEDLSLNTNYMTGNLLDCLSNLSNMQQFDISGNSFIGTLPSLLTWSKIRGISVNSNLLYGRIDQLFDSKNTSFLGSFDVSRNYFTGTIPRFAGKLIQAIYINNNELTGTIPSNIFETAPTFSIFASSINCLIGTIPTSICDSKKLLQIELDGLHSSSYCKQSLTIMNKKIPNDGVTGTIPSCLFTFPNLQILRMSGNQFTGTLPYNITSIASPKLTELVLSSNALKGTIPSYIWEYSMFKELDLSFNHFSGIIPHNISFGTPLPVSSITVLSADSQRDNSLICDQLYNTSNCNTADMIDTVITKGYYISDSSQTVGNTTNTTSSFSLHLQRNRLSGSIPFIINNMSNVNILNGNLFSCNIDRSNLPHSDPEYNSYSCGSDSINTAYECWLTLTGIVCVVIILIWLFYNKQWNTWKVLLYDNWYKTGLSNDWSNIMMQRTTSTMNTTTSSEDNISHVSIWLRSIIQFITLSNSSSSSSYCKVIESLLIVYMIVLLIIMMIINIILSKYYGTFTFKYAWIISSTYFEGISPAIILLIMLWLFLLCQLYIYQIICSIRDSLSKYLLTSNHSNINDKQGDDTSTSDQDATTSSLSRSVSLRSLGRASSLRSLVSHMNIYDSIDHQTKLQLKSLLIVIANILLVMTINIAYVITLASSHYSPSIQLILSILLSIFKMLWSRIIIIELRNQFSEIALVSISIFNNIIAPYLATLLSSVDCFWYLLTFPPSLQSNVNMIACSDVALCYDNNCHVITECSSVIDSAYNTESIEYTPPYVYSYQCSSSVLTTFAYVFVFRYLITSFGIPLRILVFKYFQNNLLHYCKHCKYNNNSNRWIYRKLLDGINLILPVLWRPCYNMEVCEDNDSQSTSSEIDSRVVDNDIVLSEMFSDLPQPLLIVNRTRLIITLVTDGAALMTYGVLVPPLAFLIALSMFVEVCFFVMSIGRLCDIIRSVKDNNHVLLDKLKQSIQHTMESFGDWTNSFKEGMKIVILVSTLLWSFLLMDTLGSVVGFKASLPIVVVMIISPVVFWYSFKCYRIGIGYFYEDKDVNRDNRTEEVELSVLSNPAVHVSVLDYHCFFV